MAEQSGTTKATTASTSGSASHRVLDAEIAALTSVKFSAPRIAKAALAIMKSQRRVIVTGMGKAGHVGKKVVATLQSTGQPAAFLHPAEALHGDLGIIEAHDNLLMFSNSGETDEVLHVARHAKNCGCLLIAVTSNPASPLVAMADHRLMYPKGIEGCPINRSPMASAITMMALGDCLAAELMVLRGFTEQQFLTFHHGGYLGRSIRSQEK